MTNIQYLRSAIDAGGCVSNAWEMVKSNYGLYLGVALIAMLLGGCIPCVSLFLVGPILGGVYFFALKAMAGEPIEFGMMFKGFEKFMPLMIIGLVQSIPEIIGQGLRITAQVGQFSLGGSRGRNYDYFQASQSDIFAGIAAGVIIMIFIIAFVLILLAIVWRFLLFFAIPIAMEHDVSPMEAIKLSAKAASSNVGGIIVLFIFEFLVSLLGLVMCGIGLILISMPIIYIANAFAYRQVFPRMNDTVNNMMPPPNAYGSSFGTGTV